MDFVFSSMSELKVEALNQSLDAGETGKDFYTLSVQLVQYMFLLHTEPEYRDCKQNFHDFYLLNLFILPITIALRPVVVLLVMQFIMYSSSRIFLFT